MYKKYKYVRIFYTLSINKLKYSYIIIFTLYNAQQSGKVMLTSRWLPSKTPSLWEYVKNITVNPRHEQVKNVLIRETSSWKMGLQSRGSWEQAVRVEHTSQ